MCFFELFFSKYIIFPENLLDYLHVQEYGCLVWRVNSAKRCLRTQGLVCLMCGGSSGVVAFE